MSGGFVWGVEVVGGVGLAEGVQVWEAWAVCVGGVSGGAARTPSPPSPPPLPSQLLTRWLDAGRTALSLCCSSLDLDLVLLASPPAVHIYPSLCQEHPGLYERILLFDASPIAPCAAFGPPRGFRTTSTTR